MRWHPLGADPRGSAPAGEPSQTGPTARVDGGAAEGAAWDDEGFEPVAVSESEFETLVEQALDEVPEEFLEALDNVMVVIEDADPDEPDLLGLYEGIPLTERAEYSGALPDRITLFREPILARCADVDEVREEVLITVVHEIGHYFGIDDDRLHELGWA